MGGSGGNLTQILYFSFYMGIAAQCSVTSLLMMMMKKKTASLTLQIRGTLPIQIYVSNCGPNP